MIEKQLWVIKNRTNALAGIPADYEYEPNAGHYGAIEFRIKIIERYANLSSQKLSG